MLILYDMYYGNCNELSPVEEIAFLAILQVLFHKSSIDVTNYLFRRVRIHQSSGTSYFDWRTMCMPFVALEIATWNIQFQVCIYHPSMHECISCIYAKIVWGRTPACGTLAHGVILATMQLTDSLMCLFANMPQQQGLMGFWKTTTEFHATSNQGITLAGCIVHDSKHLLWKSESRMLLRPMWWTI